MKIVKRTLLIVLALLLAAQAPFVYRRYKIGQAARLAAASPRVERPADTRYREYKGIIHAHTSLGGHSTGSFDELIGAANANGLDFVLMTEHYSDAFDTAALTLNGVYGKTLFVGGNEVDTADGDRFLVIPGGPDAAEFKKLPTAEVIQRVHADGRLALVTYPEKFRSWDADLDGIEVFSVHTAAKRANPLTALLDLVWSYPAYPQMTLASYFRRPDDNLARFDEVSAKRQAVLFAGTDAHSNIGFHLLGDDAGNKLFDLKIDPYAVTFDIVRVHVLLFDGQEFTRDNLLRAIRSGQAFIGFDCLGDTTGFRFEAAENGNWLQGMGGSLAARPGLAVRASAPVKARFVVFRDGVRILETAGVADISADASQPGTYRVEIYRGDLGPPFDQMPWIISNPIRVEFAEARPAEARPAEARTK